MKYKYTTCTSSPGIKKETHLNSSTKINR